MISKDDVRKLASLARIKTTPAEEEKLAGDMENILAYVQQIQTVSATAAPANGSSKIKAAHNVLRPDAEPHPTSAFTEDLLKAAPARQGQFVKVKKIL